MEVSQFKANRNTLTWKPLICKVNVNFFNNFFLNYQLKLQFSVSATIQAFVGNLPCKIYYKTILVGSGLESLKSSITKDNKNVCWKEKLYFDPESDKKDKTDYYFSHDELIKLKSLIDSNESIQKIWIYCNPLIKEHWTLSWFFYHFWGYHAFVVLKTNDWYWSIEKYNEGLTIQRCQSIEFVKNYIKQTERPYNWFCPIAQLKYNEGRYTMGDLVDWLYINNELKKDYDAGSENCKHFAKRIFDKFAKSQK